LDEKITYQSLVAFKNGDVESFKLIYNEYHSSIYYYALKFIQNESMAEEATADVFITLWKKRATINPSLPIQSLLYKVAKDIAYNYLKKIAANDRLKKEYINNYPAVDLQNGEVLLLNKEQLSQVEKVIETLPPKRLEVFKLRYYEGLDNNGIAQQLGISINTVKVHLAKSRIYLKQQIHNKQELYWALVLLFIFM